MKKRQIKNSVMHLEKGDGRTRVFWEIARSGRAIITRYGKHLSAGRRTVYELPDNAAAIRDFDAAIAKKRKDGYTECAPKPEIGDASRSGISARNEEMEAFIAEEPSDAERYLVLVYADWLQQRADPRGELIILQHAIALAMAARDMATVMRLEDMESTLITKFKEELLGRDLPSYETHRERNRSIRGLAWRYGFVRAARICPVYKRDAWWSSRGMEALVTHPAGRFLEHLVVGHLSGSVSLTRMPCLRELRVTQWREADGVPIPQSAFLHDIIDRALHHQKITHLDLEVPLCSEGIARLVARTNELATFERLGLTKVAIFDAASRAMLEKQLPNLEWLPLPEEEEIGDIEPFHHGFA